MRIFTAGLITETNTFAPWPTGMAGFEEDGLFRGDASTAGDDVACVAARTFKDLARADNHAFVEGLFATADPSGPTLTSVYESLRDEILADVRSKGPFDVVLLFLHGAMVAFGYEDCEADITRRVREIVGPQAVIGVELDPHCHLSQALIDAADCVILMKEYPHSDYAERARELYSICTRTAAGKLRPTSALFDCRMLGFYPTTTEPMSGLVAMFRRAESRDGILSVSFAHGFPWGDTRETGSKMLVVSQDNPALAATVAEELGRAVYNLRWELLPKSPSIAAALDLAAASAGTIVFGDSADNPGGGAPGDNVTFLRAMLERGVSDAALGCIWDPMAVRACVEAGVGAAFNLRFGGKAGVASGAPLDHWVTVKAIRLQHTEAGLGSSRSDLGASVWIDCAGIDVVLVSKRVQTFAPDAFTGLGIDLAAKRVIVVKSSQHYKAKFAALTDRLVNVTGPGAIQTDFLRIEYHRLDVSRIFPFVADPLG
jgi:microcystin degradation protein MlrC